MRRVLFSISRPILASSHLSQHPFFSTFTVPTTSLRSFATASTSSKTGKTAAPSTKDGDASRRTGDYGPADTHKVPLDQEGQGHDGKAPKKASKSTSGGVSGGASSHGTGKQESQADAANKAKSGRDATHSSPTPTPADAQSRKASGKSSVHGNSATDQHRRQEEYTDDRDQATGAEASVAADRAAHDPLPDPHKHSTKVHRGESH